MDSELQKRLAQIDIAAARVRLGTDPQAMHFAVSLDDHEVIQERVPVPFWVSWQRTDPQVWTAEAANDDAVGYMRFRVKMLIAPDLAFPPGGYDPDNCPGFPVQFTPEPSYGYGHMARSYCLLHWRVEADLDSLSHRDREELNCHALVMGTALSQEPGTYCHPGSGTWTLLKLVRDESAVFLAVDANTGQAEMFPRRRDPASYELALDILCTIVPVRPPLEPEE